MIDIVKNFGQKNFHAHKNMPCYNTCRVEIKFYHSKNDYQTFFLVTKIYNVKNFIVKNDG
jgi:hypothetical protein